MHTCIPIYINSFNTLLKTCLPSFRNCLPISYTRSMPPITSCYTAIKPWKCIWMDTLNWAEKKVHKDMDVSARCERGRGRRRGRKFKPWERVQVQCAGRGARSRQKSGWGMDGLWRRRTGPIGLASPPKGFMHWGIGQRICRYIL